MAQLFKNTKKVCSAALGSLFLFSLSLTDIRCFISARSTLPSLYGTESLFFSVSYTQACVKSDFRLHIKNKTWLQQEAML